MATAEERGLTKITIKVVESMYLDFDRRISALLLRRDAFIDRMIWQEIPYLRADMVGKVLSPKAHAYISGALKEVGPLRTVSVAVSQATAEALRTVIRDHNLVRDAFLNRLVMLLRASDNLLDFLELPKTTYGNMGDVDFAYTSPLRSLEQMMDDPFLHMREYSQKQFDCGLHMLNFPRKLLGMYCYLEDDLLPDEDRLDENFEYKRDLEKLESDLKS